MNKKVTRCIHTEEGEVLGYIQTEEDKNFDKMIIDKYGLKTKETDKSQNA